MKQKVDELINILNKINKIPDKSLTDYKSVKINYLIDNIKDFLKTNNSDLINELNDAINKNDIDEIIKVLNEIKREYDKIINNQDKKNKEKKKNKEIDYDIQIEEIISKIPTEIKQEISLDFDEIKKCLKNNCFRSAIMLCGKILEAALNRKYFEITGKDLIETSPGMGLGKIIAKLKEKGINFDPGVTQQIHLINNVRIHSVHIKKEIFKPTKEQTQAIFLFTTDILKKLWKNVG